MNGQEHYAQAADLLDNANHNHMRGNWECAESLSAMAQGHAALALVDMLSTLSPRFQPEPGLGEHQAAYFEDQLTEHQKRTGSCRADLDGIEQAHHFVTVKARDTADTWRECLACGVTESALDLVVKERLT